jgi:hypothetical protein
MNFVERNLDKLMLFTLVLTSLVIYGYNQTPGNKDILLVLGGAFAGYLTTVVKNLVVTTSAAETKEITKEFLDGKS